MRARRWVPVFGAVFRMVFGALFGTVFRMVFRTVFGPIRARVCGPECGPECARECGPVKPGWPTICIVIALGAPLPACVSPERLSAVNERASQLRADNDARRRAFKAAILDRDARRASQEVGKPWLAGRAQPLAREVTLPAALRRQVDTTLMFAGGPADLATLAERITRATDIPVRVRPDALLPGDHFLPRLAGTPASVQLPARAELPSGPQPLPRILDALAWRLGVYWRYTGQAIEFYRTQTRIFDVRALTLKARADARLGRTAGGENGGFENASSTTLTAGDHDALTAVRERLEPFLTRAGVVAASPGAGASVVVTDTQDTLDEIARFLERENRALTRRVRLVFEEITVIAKDEAQSGIDWDVVYRSARTAASATAAAAAAASGLAGGGAAAASLTVGAGPFRASQAIVTALSQIGTVVRHSSVPVLTLNRRPVTHAVRTSFSYVDQVQSSATRPLAGAEPLSMPTVSISQKRETVGAFLTLVPDAQDNGQILLSIAYDNTVAQPLKSLTYGKGDNALEIQQITIEGNGTVQQVELQSGQAIVISGFDRRTDDYDRRRLTSGAPLLAGGADRASSLRATTVLVVSAQVEEGF